MSAEDEQWAAAAGAGDETAFRRLVERHEAAIFRYVLRVLGCDRGVAADLTQETFLAAFQGIARFRGNATVRTWLIGIATNQIRSYLRQRAVDTARRDRFAASREATADGCEATADGCDATVGGCDATGEAIRRAFARLPQGQRHALYLREFLDYSHREIATCLGISIGAAKNRVHEARRQMLELVAADAPELFEEYEAAKYKQR